MPSENAVLSTAPVSTTTNPLEDLERKVLENYTPELLAALKAGIAVICSLSLKDRSHPLALIFEGPSGRGKSFVINMCESDRPKTHSFTYRLDMFTPKAFVSHAANVSRDQLEDIDLLPKIKDKTLLTKELAPLFRGREDDLRTNFATLTSVLDGRGHRSASGSQGTRGYAGNFVFNWLGATTPIPAQTDSIMAQLGNRLLRYEIVGEAPSEESLIDFLLSYNPSTIEDACRRAVNDVLLTHFAAHPVNSLEPREVEISTAVAQELARYGELIAYGRVEVQHYDGPEGPELVVCSPEGPHRVLLLLRTLAQGLALLRGGTSVNAGDLETIRHVAFSSLPSRRRKMLRAVLTNGGELTSKDTNEQLHISRPTARDMMRELAATGIVKLTEGWGSEPHVATLAESWSWLLPSTDPDSPAESEMGVCAGTPAET